MIELANSKKAINGFRIYLVPMSRNKIANKNHKTKKVKIKKKTSKKECPAELAKYSISFVKIV